MDISIQALAVVDRTTGATHELPFGDLTLSGHSVVKIPASYTSVLSSQRVGNDLVLKFT